MKIRSKLFLSYILLVLLSIGILTIISVSEASKKIEKETSEALEHHLGVVWKQYYVRAEQMRLGMLQAASTMELKEAVSKKDRGFLKNRLLLWKSYRPYVDFWLVVDGSGRVIARLGGGQGDAVSFNGVVERALLSKSPVVSTELLTREELQREGVNSGMRYLVNGRGMALIVATPVLLEGKVVGGIVTGDLLNGDKFLPEELRDVIREASVALVQEGTVVSALPKGVLGMGAVLPEKVLIRAAEGVSGTQVMIGDEEWLIYADVIRDNKGNALGMALVGAPRAMFFAHVAELKRSIIITAILAMTFALILAVMSTLELTNPIMELVAAVKRIRHGELGVRVKSARVHGKDELGELTRAFNTMSTELKESYESLREALEYNESIITNAPVGIFTTDRRGRITSANPRHGEIMGWGDPEEGLGLDLLNLPSIKDRGWDKLLDKALGGESVELYHEEYTSAFGKKVFINLKAVPMKKEEEIQGLLVLVEDITDRIEAEKRVEELSQFPERNPNPVFKVGLSGEILYHNPGVFNYVKSTDELEELLPQGYRDLVKTACSSGKEIKVEHRYKGRVLGYVLYPISRHAAHVYARDITERKTYEEELRRRISELERMHRVMVGRELRMKELKERIRELEKESRGGDG
jgi:PAS domain S-box-containing protein